MNCFQISNFVLWQTARENWMKYNILLWIAFKLVILSYGKQLKVINLRRIKVVNCFQISNFVLWQTASDENLPWFGELWIAFKLVILSYGKQQGWIWNRHLSVVNCFQISNFVLWQTAKRYWIYSQMRLWIAFKLVILSYGKQPIQDDSLTLRVVNCFQISNFVLWQTAFQAKLHQHSLLWIAFKLVILSYGKQLDTCNSSFCFCCELLSN